MLPFVSSITSPAMPSLSKADLDAAVQRLQEFTKEQLGGVEQRLMTKAEGLRSETKDDLRDLVQHFNASQASQNATLKEIEVKITAILEMGAVRQEVINLVRELKAHGITLDERKIFVGHPDAAAL